MTRAPVLAQETPKAASAERFAIEIARAEAGQRLDTALTSALGRLGRSLSRTRVRALIEEGAVENLDPCGQAAATIVEASERVKPGSRYRVTLPPARPATPQAQALPLAVVFEDDAVIVIDKPTGLVVHPAPGNPDRTLVNALLAHCGSSLSGIGGVIRPGIVHRLDKETSGLMVVAKTDQAHHGLAAQFASHGRDGRLHRLYLALVHGVPVPATGTIDAPIGRSPRNRKKFALAARGKPAVTHYAVTKQFGRQPVASLLVCRLETGRTHQIRVHLSAKGHPVLADSLYGARSRRARTAASSALAEAVDGLDRQALHAAELGFIHPVSGRRLLFASPLPADLRGLVTKLEQL